MPGIRKIINLMFISFHSFCEKVLAELPGTKGLYFKIRSKNAGYVPGIHKHIWKIRFIDCKISRFKISFKKSKINSAKWAR